MILKGNQRAGGRQMALHLLNGEQNEHVNVHEVSGFMAQDVLGALNEAYALSKGTKCKQFMYSLSLNPPQDEKVDIETFEKTLERVEQKLGLEGQPRVVVFHEKEGRRHAHCVWSRINTDEMKAVNISHPKLKLNDISKSLYLEHGWKMPEGFKDKTKKNPLNFTRAEWQQAKRVGRKASDIKSELQECWAISDTKTSFEHALREKGYFLAKGDKRGFVALDVYGEVYSLTRQLGQKAKALEARLGNAKELPSVQEVKNGIQGQLSKLFDSYKEELRSVHNEKLKPLLADKAKLTNEHRSVRASLKEYQQKRWQAEELKRSARIRKGFKGIWDKLNGRYWKTRKRNEQEAWQAHLRDRKQQEELIQKQLSERQNLQTQIQLLRDTQEKERQALVRDLSHVAKHEEKSKQAQRSKTNSQSQNTQNTDAPNRQNRRDDDKGMDFEPEI
ncbi:hypothetical protein NBRC116494_06670 [Aurantivibrio plasticivorans]